MGMNTLYGTDAAATYPKDPRVVASAASLEAALQELDVELDRAVQLLAAMNTVSPPYRGMERRSSAT